MSKINEEALRQHLLKQLEWIYDYFRMRFKCPPPVNMTVKQILIDDRYFDFRDAIAEGLGLWDEYRAAMEKWVSEKHDPEARAVGDRIDAAIDAVLKTYLRRRVSTLLPDLEYGEPKKIRLRPMSETCVNVDVILEKFKLKRK